MKRYINVVITVASIMLMTLLSACGQSPVPLSEMPVEKYVTLGNYMGLSATKQTIEISDEMVDVYVDYDLQQATTELKAVDRPAKIGDTVNIDYEGKRDGEPFKGGTSQGYDLRLGSHSFIDGFEDGLVGVSAGDTIDLNLTFPENYQAEELAGVAVVFTVKVNEVKGGPSLEEFAASKGFASVDAYKADVKENLQIMQQFSADSDTKDQLFSQIQAGCDYKKLPDWYIDKYYDMLIKRWVDTASQYGMTLSDFAQNYFQMTMADFEADTRKTAEEAAKRGITCEAIFRREAMTLEEADYTTYLKSMGYESLEEIPNVSQEDIRDDVMADKVLSYVMNNATLTEKND